MQNSKGTKRITDIFETKFVLSLVEGLVGEWYRRELVLVVWIPEIF
jgi:hypothetical protein